MAAAPGGRSCAPGPPCVLKWGETCKVVTTWHLRQRGWLLSFAFAEAAWCSSPLAGSTVTQVGQRHRCAGPGDRQAARAIAEPRSDRSLRPRGPSCVPGPRRVLGSKRDAGGVAAAAAAPRRGLPRGPAGVCQDPRCTQGSPRVSLLQGAAWRGRGGTRLRDPPASPDPFSLPPELSGPDRPLPLPLRGGAPHEDVCCLGVALSPKTPTRCPGRSLPLGFLLVTSAHDTRPFLSGQAETLRGRGWGALRVGAGVLLRAPSARWGRAVPWEGAQAPPLSFPCGLAGGPLRRPGRAPSAAGRSASLNSRVLHEGCVSTRGRTSHSNLASCR